MIVRVLFNRGIELTTVQLLNCIYAVISLQLQCTNNSTAYLVDYLYNEDTVVVLTG